MTTTRKDRRNPLTRVLSSVAVLVATVLGTMVVSAPAANAAENAAVTVCFEDSTHFTRFGLPWMREVRYNLYNPSTGRWQIQARYASPNGCTVFSVYPGYQTFFEVYEEWSGMYYSAQTWTYFFAAGSSHHLGHYSVVRVLTF